MILEPKLGLPVLLMKVVSKTFPTLLEYKNLIFFGSPRDCCQHSVVWSRPPDSVLADAVWVQCFYAIRLTVHTPFNRRPSLRSFENAPLEIAAAGCGCPKHFARTIGFSLVRFANYLPSGSHVRRTLRRFRGVFCSAATSPPKSTSTTTR